MFTQNHRPQLSTTLFLALITLTALCGCSDNPVAPAGPDEFTAQDKLRPVPPIPDPGGTQTPSSRYFPLQDGNRWLYVSDDGQRMAEVRISGTARMGDQQVFAMENYLFPIATELSLFYNDSSDRTMEYIDLVSEPWYPIGEFGQGALVRVVLPAGDDCIHGSAGESSGSFDYATVPAGEFPQAITIDYHTRPCEDSGLVREVLASGVGLIERTVMTMHGPETWSLTYAEVDGEEYGSLPH